MSYLNYIIRQIESNDYKLTELYLSEKYIQDDGAIKIAKALKNNNKLTTLCLKMNNIGDDGIIALSQSLKENNSLKWLNLYNNHIGDKGAIALAKILINNQGLDILDLESNNISNEGAIAIAQSIKQNDKLTVIDLQNNSFDDQGAKELIEALKINHKIIKLDMKDNNISDELMDKAKFLVNINKILAYKECANSHVIEKALKNLKNNNTNKITFDNNSINMANIDELVKLSVIYKSMIYSSNIPLEDRKAKSDTISNNFASLIIGKIKDKDNIPNFDDLHKIFKLGDMELSTLSCLEKSVTPIQMQALQNYMLETYKLDTDKVNSMPNSIFKNNMLAELKKRQYLRQMQNNENLYEMLEIWNDRAISFGIKVLKKRIEYINNINEKAKEIYFGISGDKEEISISYKPLGMNVEEYLKNPNEIYENMLKKSLKSDIRLGVTSAGPHRDDCEILINGLESRIYGSQGQQRSAVIAMKLAEAEVLVKSIGESPIILLDDVMSELDNNRQSYILNELKGRQIFITCCSPETINLMNKGKMFHVKNGIIVD